MYHKSKVTDGPAGGIVFPLSKNKLFFLGIQEQLLVLSAKQNFSEIIKFKVPSGSKIKKIECVVNKCRFDKFRLPASINETAIAKNNYVHFNLRGQIHYSPEGIIFGILPLEIDYISEVIHESQHYIRSD